MRLMCVFTVASLRYSMAAISELLNPRAVSRNSSFSRAVRVANSVGTVGVAGVGVNYASNPVVADAAITEFPA